MTLSTPMSSIPRLSHARPIVKMVRRPRYLRTKMVLLARNAMVEEKAVPEEEPRRDGPDGPEGIAGECHGEGIGGGETCLLEKVGRVRAEAQTGEDCKVIALDGEPISLHD